MPRRSVASSSTRLVVGDVVIVVAAEHVGRRQRRGEVADRILAGPHMAMRQLEPAPAMKPLCERRDQARAHERRLAAARRADDGEEPRGAQAAQQVVDFLLAAEEEMIFVRLERTKAGKGIKQTRLPSPAR